MASNHEEYSNDITLEKFKYSLQICWGCTYLFRKTNEGTWGNYISF